MSWSHIVELLPIKNKEAKSFYVAKIAEENWSVRQTRKKIESKTFEKTKIIIL